MQTLLRETGTCGSVGWPWMTGGIFSDWGRGYAIASSVTSSSVTSSSVTSWNHVGTWTACRLRRRPPPPPQTAVAVAAAVAVAGRRPLRPCPCSPSPDYLQRLLQFFTSNHWNNITLQCIFIWHMEIWLKLGKFDQNYWNFDLKLWNFNQKRWKIDQNYEDLSKIKEIWSIFIIFG